MATWAQLETAAPELAEAGRALFYQFGNGLAFLATVRWDGGPRLHPICVVVAEGGLFGFILPSPKRVDLARDGRYALHSFPPEATDDEFYVTGTALTVEDAARRDAVAAAYQNPVHPTDDLFEFLIESALLARYRHRGDWPPTYTRWRADAGPG